METKQENKTRYFEVIEQPLTEIEITKIWMYWLDEEGTCGYIWNHKWIPHKPYLFKKLGYV